MSIRLSGLKVALVSFLALFPTCARKPLKSRVDALRPATIVPTLDDDLPLKPLLEGIGDLEERLKATPSAATLTFGKRVVTRDDYLLGLDAILDAGKGDSPEAAVASLLKDGFDFYEVYGAKQWGEVLLTSYYEPEIAGSHHKSQRFSQALYKVPRDLVDVAVGKFDEERFPNAGSMRGRLVDRRAEGGSLELDPYYSRAEIDEEGALRGKGLELCWTDPVDAFFMQIQGSGTVIFEDQSRVRLGFADKNGHRYESIGKFLTHLIPLEGMTMQAIESYLKGLPLDKAQGIMSRNPSYVFFRRLNGPAVTSFGTAAVAGRTIATDSRFFPKGTLGLLTFDKPEFGEAATDTPTGWQPVARLVLDVDAGGAIRGGGRVDLFWGTGPEAKRSAGVIKQKAHLYYLAPKESWLETARLGH